MRRVLFVAIGAFFLAAALLPTQPAFVVSAVSDGERLAMISKPSVVRIVDGALGTICSKPKMISRRTRPPGARTRRHQLTRGRLDAAMVP